jgi:hypothetical protein
MPAKFKRCVKKVKAQHRNVNPYAVCRVATGFYGSTHHSKMKHKKQHKKRRHSNVGSVKFSLKKGFH